MRITALAAALLLLAALPAFAHRVNIHAWLEGDSVQVRCAFSRGSPVRNGRVAVYAATDGEELLNGATDDKGFFRFPVPVRARESGLRIRINAGEGHENEWRMEAREFAAREIPTPETNTAVPTARRDGGHAAESPASAGLDAASPQEVRRIVSELMEANLAPLRRDLAALANPEPGIREIVGGLGWLVGLAGLVLYFRSRKRP
ncbi:MAG: pollen Ole e 1 allergen/extensin family protein [Desulfovibrio sp.]|jgi:nickel transport protein|nr:pollen Ole e 1 allergen/extensin family protein [Desulfovibrio sp.]